MGRQAKIIGKAVDIFDVEFEVRERRATDHGFAVLIGWPTGQRGPGYGGPRVILTQELAEYLEAHRHTPAHIDLPIGKGPVKRLRALAGYDWRRDRELWWESRLPDLLVLTIEEFAALHDISAGAVSRWRARLIGPWLCSMDHQVAQQYVQESLALPTRQACERLGISPAQASKLRARLKKAAEQP